MAFTMTKVTKEYNDTELSAIKILIRRHYGEYRNILEDFNASITKNDNHLISISVVDIARYLSNISINEDTHCWEWTGSLKPKEYSSFHSKYRLVSGHRFAYELFNNIKIPSNMVIDHLCRNHKCVNPEHLEMVTHSVNVKRGLIPSIITQYDIKRKLNRTHCPQGHPYSKENTRILNNGARRCIICMKKGQRETYQRCKLKWKLKKLNGLLSH